MIYHILCTSTNVNIGIPVSKRSPETYFAEGPMMTCLQVETCSLCALTNVCSADVY